MDFRPFASQKSNWLALPDDLRAWAERMRDDNLKR
jgi:hypothetical protein